MFHCFACYKAEFFKRRWQSWKAIFLFTEILYRELEVIQMQKNATICMGGKLRKICFAWNYDTNSKYYIGIKQFKTQNNAAL